MCSFLRKKVGITFRVSYEGIVVFKVNSHGEIDGGRCPGFEQSVGNAFVVTISCISSCPLLCERRDI